MQCYNLPEHTKMHPTGDQMQIMSAVDVVVRYAISLHRQTAICTVVQFTPWFACVRTNRG